MKKSQKSLQIAIQTKNMGLKIKENPLRSIGIAYFTIYFTLNIFENIFLIYFPLYFLTVINVDPSELAFIQFLSYSSLFILPGLGFIFDKFMKKQKKLLISIFGAVLPVSFLFILLNPTNLIFYMVFLLIYLLSRSIVKGGMSNLYFKYFEVKDYNEKEKIKNFIIKMTNISSTLGSLTVSIIFSYIFIEINSLKDWWIFFLCVWIISLPIFIGIFKIKIPLENSIIVNKKDFRNPKENLISFTENYRLKNKILPMILIFIAYFFTLSDALFEYPFSSWMYLSFGDLNFRIILIVYSFNSLIGQWFAGRFSKGTLKNNKNAYKKKKQLALTCIIIQAVIFSIYPFSNVWIFIIALFSLGFFGSVMNIVFCDLMTDIANLGKYKTFRYQLLYSSWSLATFLLVPIGTQLSFSIPVENLMYIASGLTLMGLLPLMVMKNPNRR